MISNLGAEKVDQKVIPKSETEHSFINSLSPIFNKVSNEYVFKLNTNFTISLSVDSLMTDINKYDYFLEAVRKMPYDYILKLIKENNVLAQKHTELLLFFKENTEYIHDKSSFLIVNDSLKIKYNKDSIIYDSDSTYSLLANLIKNDTNLSLIKEVLVKPDFESMLKFDFTEDQKNQLSLLYRKLFGNDEYEFIGNYRANNGDTVGVHEVSIKQNSKQKFFELRICKNSTINCKNSIRLELNIDIRIEKGAGYLTIDELKQREEDVEVLLIDTNFSPVSNVKYNIAQTRFGDITNLDSLEMDIETNGSISSVDALKFSANMLNSYFSVFNEDSLQVEGQFISNVADLVSKEKEEETTQKTGWRKLLGN